ncbi:MAG: uncharacterized protein A8A55_2724 [Amphiamblys sp. WSBS2006]|nr:MAG: uncharacterized protein A8A55_2724 [Amphiamblys sp. WSBS2006]
MWLTGAACNILLKLEIPEDNVFEEMFLSAWNEYQIAPILESKEKIRIGKCNKMELECAACNILLMLEIPEDNVLEALSLFVKDESKIAPILKSEEISVAGRCKKLTLSGRGAQKIHTKLGDWCEYLEEGKESDADCE